MQTGWPRPSVEIQDTSPLDATHREPMETTDQDRLFVRKFDHEGLREQWLPTHHCLRENKRGVMENLV
jgi:hypothetical protein